ncbi:hypothetical protein J2W25_002170 [Variovorax boronicumulans]|uniref:ESPR domain-containing protein n=1 Tax=Variovorax boronicumulans TaxID=436515 RepID=A0AAW8DUN6_9BURK|nr:hypothetical protein [Variovorax boronicumulans]MDP9877865.1 hypothetical protein [Variovorax boronicumulans]MDP9923149.1 hypothetical protein [Variovorax boronicumulans]
MHHQTLGSNRPYLQSKQGYRALAAALWFGAVASMPAGAQVSASNSRRACARQPALMQSGMLN